MKILSGSLIFVIALLFASGCGGNSTSKKNQQTGADTSTVADTGYTGIKQYMSGQNLIKEVTFKNGIREGLMKSFYQNGKLRQTFWYTNGLRTDSARWYYEDGRVFRTTPYVNDTIEGIQKQFYRTGKIKAKIGYKKGLRTPFFEEYDQNGKLVSGYPSVIVNILDQYKTKGLYRISLGLSDKSTKVKFYRGDFSAGAFDTTQCKSIKVIKGIGTLDLKKTGTSKSVSVGVIGEILTSFGNKYLVYKKIDLPYNDLN
jgi:hypothetical protein